MAISEEQLKRLAEQLPDASRDPQDSLVGLIPVVGDIATALMGAYIVWEARNLGMSKLQLTRMAANVGIDTALGAIPFAGDVFDFFWRSNSKNLKIIRKHLDKHHPGTRTIEG